MTLMTNVSQILDGHKLGLDEKNSGIIKKRGPMRRYFESVSELVSFRYKIGL